MIKHKEFISKSVGETKKFAKDLAKNLKAGDILAICGPLGAGKTTFIQGLAASLGYSGRVFSPTFVFVRPYTLENGKQKTENSKKKIKTLYHIDLYRIEDKANLRTIGIEEFMTEENAISAIEWPERIKDSLPRKTIEVEITPLSSKERRIKVT